MTEEYTKGSGKGRGGWRGGGRPKGSTSSKGPSNRTERFTRALTPEEKEYLEKCLNEFRERKEELDNLRFDSDTYKRKMD